MQQAKKGDQVSVHYHGRLLDGTTFDKSDINNPLKFTVGVGQVIKGFDDAVILMVPGEKKTVEIPVDEAYGPYNEEMVIEYPRAEFPEDMNIEEGIELQMSDNTGNVFNVTVAEVLDDVVVLDANHPLAGESLIFDIELLAIG